MSFTSSNIAPADRKVLANQQHMQLAEQLRQDWVVNAEEGTTIEDVLNPFYWSEVSKTMQRFDHVEVRLETGEWIAFLIVTDAGPTWASVQLTAMHDLGVADQNQRPLPPAMHEVVRRGPTNKWCVKRLSDGAMLQEGLETKAAAQSWLENYESTIRNT